MIEPYSTHKGSLSVPLSISEEGYCKGTMGFGGFRGLGLGFGISGLRFWGSGCFSR